MTEHCWDSTSLFFYNGGDKSGVWKPETMSRKVAETAGEVLSPTASGMGILSGSLSGGQVTEVYLGGYRLATDEEGSAFSRQICEAMKASLELMEYSSFPRN